MKLDLPLRTAGSLTLAADSLATDGVVHWACACSAQAETEADHATHKCWSCGRAMERWWPPAFRARRPTPSQLGKGPIHV